MQSPKVQLSERYPVVSGFSSVMDIVGLCRTLNVTDTYITQYLWVRFLKPTTTPFLSTEMYFSKDPCKLLKYILLSWPLASKIMAVMRWEPMLGG